MEKTKGNGFEDIEVIVKCESFNITIITVYKVRKKEIDKFSNTQENVRSCTT